MASDAGDLAAEYTRRHAAARVVGAPLAAVLDYLRFCRLNHVGEPGDVWPLAHGVLTRGGERGLGADYYSVLEQAVVAGYAVGGDDAPAAADGYLAVLQVAWPGSARVGRLDGLRLESRGDTDGAVAVYDEILAKHPSHAPSWKRKVSALAGAGRDTDALKALNAYLEAFPGDVEAWTEAAEMQVALGRPAQAAFCVEEALLAAPSNAALHARLAELLSYVGTRDALRNARLHASQAVKLVTAAAAGDAAGAAPVPLAAAWPLTLLADVCYLHWCVGLGRKPAARTWPAKPRGSSGGGASSSTPSTATDALLGGGEVGWGGRTTAELTALARELAAAPPASTDASSAAVPAEASKTLAAVAADASLREDISLQAWAAERLAKLAAAGSQAGRGSSGSAGFAFPGLAAACASKWNADRVAAIGEAMLATAPGAPSAAAAAAAGTGT